MITYAEPDAKGKIKVRLEGKYVGDICPHRDGFFYKPRKSYGVGELRPTIAAVKRSLEGDDQ